MTMPTEFSWESCAGKIARDMELLCDEVARLDLVFRQTKFFGTTHNFPNIHMGTLMACMSKLDFLSLCVDPSNKSQSERMAAFLDKYVAPAKPKVNRLILKMFRHSLMHTGALRYMTNRAKTEVYTWRLFWSEASGGDRHYEISEVDSQYQDQILAVHQWKYPNDQKPKTMCLHCRVTDFTLDLQAGSESFLAEVRQSPEIQGKIVRAYRQVAMEAAGL